MGAPLHLSYGGEGQCLSKLTLILGAILFASLCICMCAATHIYIHGLGGALRAPWQNEIAQFKSIEKIMFCISLSHDAAL